MPAPSPSERVTREDLLTFVSASFACTGQREFYSDGRGQAVSIQFLHDYVLGNYRRLYARALACGINHYNQAEIIVRLLATGKHARPEDRAEESALITRALERLPTNRAMRLLERLADERVNNRRTRALIERYLARADVRDFRAVKYRRRFRRGAIHAHMPLAGELGPFFLRGWKERRFKTPLFESFRQAHYAERAIYELPYTIAEGLARKHGVPRDVFLARIEPQLTTLERLRLQETTRRELGASVALDTSRLSPTRVASWALNLPIAARVERREELHAALTTAAERAVRRTGAQYGKVACVLDRSYSSSGSSEKRRRPLAVALSTSYFFRAASREARSFWTLPIDGPDGRSDELFVTPSGQTDLATPLLNALAFQPDLIVVVSDGFENDPPDVAGDLLIAARRRGLCPFVLHVNPVYDDTSIAPKPLCARAAEIIPTMGIREAEDIPTAIAFSSFADGSSSLADLERALAARVAAFLGAPKEETNDEEEPAREP